MSKLPPLNALRAFEAAGRCLNFRVASDELGVTQGAVAQHVRHLETHLGVPLFERLSKGLAFTDAGRSYHVHIAAAFDEMQSATDNLKPESGKVLISVTPSFAAKWLIPNLPAFSAAHPEIDLRILATEGVSSFHRDGINLAIRQSQPPFGAALDATLLFSQEIIAVAAPTLVHDHSLPLDAETLARLPKLHDAHDLWPEFLKMLHVKDQGGFGLRLSQTSLALDAALSGQGAVLVSRFLVARNLAANNLVQISPHVLLGKQGYYLLAARKPKRSQATESVMTWLKSHVTNVGALADS